MLALTTWSISYQYAHELLTSGMNDYTNHILKLKNFKIHISTHFPFFRALRFSILISCHLED